MKCVATCAFGVETALKNEMKEAGFVIERSDNGKVYFDTDLAGMIEANMALRTADRIFIVLGAAIVKTFDALFAAVKQWDLHRYLEPTGRFLIQAKSVKSTLYSLRDIQSIGKKALIENLKTATGQAIFPETGAPHPLLFNLVNDQVELWLDTSGEALHKRGYRLKQGEAPIKETLAAALVLLSFYQSGRPLYDPFCGAGTLVIEAAMLAKKMAPNLNRTFAFDAYSFVDQTVRKRVRVALLKRIDQTVTPHIHASDIDRHIVEAAMHNAEAAGVDDIIHFQVSDYKLRAYDAPFGLILTNPPYGERLDTTDEAEKLYQGLAARYHQLTTYSLFMITAYPGIEGIFRKQANRTRVFFNGNIKARYYQFHGPKAPAAPEKS
ncbi:MAG: class I SAM-dependent RNA methyltransferase [Acholeplasmatales bacterium]|nr:MAG: class I SAM-dependent RNA methyltransferase [Acholeplasmatales bacterium]